MRSWAIIIAALVFWGTAVALVGEALGFRLTGLDYLVALVIAGFLTSLVDRERFYGVDSKPRPR